MTTHTQPETYMPAVSWRDRLTGLGALLALAGVVAGVPWLLLRFGADLVPAQLNPRALLRVLLRPDDGTAALTAITVIAWAAWAVIAVSVIVEAAALLRGTPPPRLPGLALPQWGARHLVATAALLFLTGPLMPGATAAPTPAAAPAAATPAAAGADHRVDPARPLKAAAGPVVAAPSGQADHARVHVVRAGDTLWQLAERYLGDGDRYPEIAAANPTALHGQPDLLHPGTRLHIPNQHRSRSATARTVTVQRGDTLSAIAAMRLGDADRYPEIARASRHITQPGGQHLTDPDIIDIGWKLRIPTGEASHTHADSPPRIDRDTDRKPGRPTTPSIQPPQRADHPSNPATPAPSANTNPIPPNPTPRNPVPSAAASAPAEQQVDSSGWVTPGWLLTGLTGGGVLLAAGLLIGLRQRRRTQFRSRRPGWAMTGPGPELAPVEKTIVAAGDPAVPTVEFVDDLLRRLGAAHATTHLAMPRLLAVELSTAGLTLHLDEPCHLSEPWDGPDEHLTWTVPNTIDPDRVGPPVADQPAPWPLLATLGADDDGSVWLLNYEEIAAISLTGDPDYARDLARHLAAEMACNPWSQHVHVDCVGIAHEVVPMSPDRIHPHPATALATVLTEAEAAADTVRDRAAEAGVNTATGRAHLTGADVWAARLLLVDTTNAGTGGQLEQLDRLVGLATGNPGRTGTALIVHGADQSLAEGLILDLSDDGRLTAPQLGLELVAVGLTADEAAGCAALLAQTDDDTPTPMPRRAHTDGWRQYADEAGNLAEEHTEPRRAATTHPAAEGSVDTETGPTASRAPVTTSAQNEASPNSCVGSPEVVEPTSVLPAADEAYVEVAATTAEDLAVLAPAVPASTCTAVEDADPSLDADLDAWSSDTCALPRLVLLGPVGVRAHGAAIVKRKPYYTELVAYLATRRHGATPDEVADAFSITPARARNDVKIVRDWLGTNPLTGRLHLPDARDSTAAQARGVGVYQLEDVLVDADLFRRLRVRGQARGPAGITDLQRALTLVTGQPLDKLRPGGWTWMYEGDRLDQHLACAITDTAHIITTHHLHTSNLTAARAAAETALRAAPFEEITRLDLAALTDAEGRRYQAQLIVAEQICNRSDDEQAPIDLPVRTQHILEHHRAWSQKREAS